MRKRARPDGRARMRSKSPLDALQRFLRPFQRVKCRQAEVALSAGAEARAGRAHHIDPCSSLSKKVQLSMPAGVRIHT